MKDSLNIKINGLKSGSITLENDEYIYHYTTDNKDDFISLTMPIRTKDYIHNMLHPIFEMHLPEGYLLSIIKKHFSKIVTTNDFGLLKLMSPFIKGRISYESKKDNFIEPLSLDDLLYPKSDMLFDELVHRFAFSSALSGVQPKVLASVENKATLKYDDYIIKSWGEDYQELALNEYFCMKVVQEAGVLVPEFFISKDDKLFIMKRFDILDDGKVLGFEDMCVLQAKQRDDKYDGSYEKISKTIKLFVSKESKKDSLKDFYKMIVINNLLQNGDAHLKNFGLLYDGIDNIKLAPAYDIVCTTVYIKNDIPALNLLGSKKWWDKKFLIRFGKESCDLSQKEAENCYDECIVAIREVSTTIKTKQQSVSKEKYEFLEKLLCVFQRAEENLINSLF